MQNHSTHPADATPPPSPADAIYVYGNFRVEALRLHFCNYLIRLGELEIKATEIPD